LAGGVRQRMTTVFLLRIKERPKALHYL